MATNYFIRDCSGAIKGPFSEKWVGEALAHGRITDDMDVRQGSSDWVTAGRARNVFLALHEHGWFVRTDDGISGPLVPARVRELIRMGNISKDSQVRKGKQGDWVSVADVVKKVRSPKKSLTRTGRAKTDSPRTVSLNSVAIVRPSPPDSNDTQETFPRWLAAFTFLGAVAVIVVAVAMGIQMWPKAAKHTMFVGHWVTEDGEGGRLDLSVDEAGNAYASFGDTVVGFPVSRIRYQSDSFGLFLSGGSVDPETNSDAKPQCTGRLTNDVLTIDLDDVEESLIFRRVSDEPRLAFVEGEIPSNTRFEKVESDCFRLVPVDGYTLETEVDLLAVWRPGSVHDHVVAGDIEGTWEPEEGYDWEVQSKRLVKWSPGKRHSKHPKVLSGKKEGYWHSDFGYRFEKTGEQEQSARRGLAVKWSPGLKHPTHSNVVTGRVKDKLTPAPGYAWESNEAGDFRVKWSPGKEHSDHPNVVAANARDKWNAKPGYTWVSNAQNDLRVVASPNHTNKDVDKAIAIGVVALAALDYVMGSSAGPAVQEVEEKKWERCWRCKGFGEYAYGGNPASTCYTCSGEGWVVKGSNPNALYQLWNAGN